MVKVSKEEDYLAAAKGVSTHSTPVTTFDLIKENEALKKEKQEWQMNYDLMQEEAYRQGRKQMLEQVCSIFGNDFKPIAAEFEKMLLEKYYDPYITPT